MNADWICNRYNLPYRHAYLGGGHETVIARLDGKISPVLRCCIRFDHSLVVPLFAMSGLKKSYSRRIFKAASEFVPSLQHDP